MLPSIPCPAVSVRSCLCSTVNTFLCPALCKSHPKLGKFYMCSANSLCHCYNRDCAQRRSISASSESVRFSAQAGAEHFWVCALLSGHTDNGRVMRTTSRACTQGRRGLSVLSQWRSVPLGTRNGDTVFISLVVEGAAPLKLEPTSTHGRKPLPSHHCAPQEPPASPLQQWRLLGKQ